MTHEDIEFMRSVKDYVTSNPHVAAHLANYIQMGIDDHIAEQRKRASDFETLTAILMERKFKQKTTFMTQILERWKGKSNINWDTTIQKLKESKE